MCVKDWFQKFKITNLKTVKCLGFFNIEEFYQSCNFGCFWWIIFTFKPICCAYQNLCMTFMNTLGNSSIFKHHEKVVKKSNDQRNQFFQIVDLTSWLVTQGQKKVWTIFKSLKFWLMTESIKVTQSWICFQFLLNNLKAYAVNAQSLTFESEQTRCSRGCSTNTFVIYWLIQSVILFLQIFRTS